MNIAAAYRWATILFVLMLVCVLTQYGYTRIFVYAWGEYRELLESIGVDTWRVHPWRKDFDATITSTQVLLGGIAGALLHLPALIAFVKRRYAWAVSWELLYAFAVMWPFSWDGGNLLLGLMRVVFLIAQVAVWAIFAFWIFRLSDKNQH